MVRSQLTNMVRKHEGYQKYLQTNANGQQHIGYGYNLDDGMPEDEALLLMNYRLEKLEQELSATFPWYTSLSQVRKEVLLDMAYNLGINGLLQLPAVLTACANKTWSLAASAMLHSTWASRVGPRAHSLALMMKHDDAIFTG